MSDLKTLSEAMVQAVQHSANYTVRVEARRRLSATGVVWSADGLIVTTNHVVERDDNINVGLPDGTTVAATLVGRDPNTDIALLRVQSTGLQVPTWIPTDQVKVGQLALAVGRPGEQVNVTLGIISAVGSGNSQRFGGKRRFIQTDVVMYPGYSGGPLVSVEGEVFGLNTSGLREGTSITIPTAVLQRVASALASDGKIKHGYLGVGAHPVRLPDALRDEVGQETGLMLMSVESGSPAERDGLLIGDILVAADDMPLRHMDGLLGYLANDKVGQEAIFKVVRGGQLTKIKVTIGERE